MSINGHLLKELPKVELHLHLDCSLSYNVVKKLSPEITEQKYQQDFIAPPKCKDLADFLRCTVGSIELMQTGRNLQHVVDDLFTQLQAENVIYAEIRFGPLLHSSSGLSPEQVVEIIGQRTAENSERTGIKAGLILATLRHYSQEQSMQTVKLIEKYMNDYPVVGFDIAADEAWFSVDNHIKAFQYAIDKGIPRTAHAGEAKGPESVWETLTHFQPLRIGHGVRSIEDEKLVEHLAANNILLEVCPTSNIQTHVYDEFTDHPIDKLYDADVNLCVNTDGRSLTNTTLMKEYLKLYKTFGWNLEYFLKVNLNALKGAFTSAELKIELEHILKTEYNKVRET